MKLGLIVPGFSAHAADWSIPALQHLVDRLSQFVEVHVFALRYPPERRIYSLGRATVHALGGGMVGGWRNYPLWTRSVAAILAEHRRSPFDRLHAFWLHDPGTVAGIAARLAGVPVIVSLGGAEMAAVPDIHYGQQLHSRQSWVMRQVARQAVWISGGSRYILQLAAQRLPAACHDRLVLAPLGVDTHLFSPAPERAQGPGNTQQPVILQAASLLPVKDQATLLRAFRQVVDWLPGATLALVGQGPAQARLETLAVELQLTGQVRFLGSRPHPDLVQYYRSADLFVLSSRHEAQGMVVLEAAACGLPTVGTAVGVVPDLAPEGALATPPGDDRALGQAMIEILTDPARRVAMSQAARSRVLAEYSLEQTVDRFLDLYQLHAII